MALPAEASPPFRLYVDFIYSFHIYVKQKNKMRMCKKKVEIYQVFI